MFYQYAFQTDNNYFLSAEQGGGGGLYADRDRVQGWEKFSVIPVDHKHVAIQTYKGKYLVALNGGDDVARADRNRVGEWEKFEIVRHDDGLVSLKTSGGYFLSACDGGGPGQGVSAYATKADRWEKFRMLEFPVEYISLQAFNGQYVTAEEGGGRETANNRNFAGPWERFKVIHFTNGEVAFQTENGHYLCAINGGGSVVVANPNLPGPWERFRVEEHWGGRISIRSFSGHFLCAEGGGGREVVANRGNQGAWELFNVILWEGQGFDLVEGEPFKVRKGGRRTSRIITDRPVWVKPESGSNTVIKVMPGQPYESNYDGINVGGRVFKFVDNCDDVVIHGRRVDVYCSNYSLDAMKIKEKYSIDLSISELPLTSGLLEIYQYIIGGELEEAPDNGWEPIFQAPKLSGPEVNEVSRRLHIHLSRRDQDSAFQEIDRKQYQEWERADREWVNRTA